MKVQAENEPYADINITPMLDLAYVLLIIFIIMTTASVQGIKVNLPQASKSPSLGKPKTKAITISNDGRTATTHGESAPTEGFIDNSWFVASGDPPGIYEMTVTLDGGRSAVFRFRLGEPIAAPEEPQPKATI